MQSSIICSLMIQTGLGVWIAILGSSQELYMFHTSARLNNQIPKSEIEMCMWM